MSLLTEDPLLERAFELAQLADAGVSPNPRVGAVIVRADRVLGEGYRTGHGGPHAERVALDACVEDPRGATLYVSLEPCCQEGEIAPCTDVIIAAGIARVVIGTDDPTGRASGRGPGILRDEGIEVVYAAGAQAHRARLIIQDYRKHARTGRPQVLFTAAMSLDGKVATRIGDSRSIASANVRELALRLRAERDAAAVGIGTVLTDDAWLTERGDGAEHQPKRVVFDSEGRLPLDSRLVRDTPELPLIVVVGRAAPRFQTDALQGAGAEVIVAIGENDPARVRSALDQLGAMDVTSLLLEGGPRLAGAFFDAGEIDELRLFVAPVLLGGASARDPLEGDGVERIAEATRARSLQIERIGEDLLLSARLREW